MLPMHTMTHTRRLAIAFAAVAMAFGLGGCMGAAGKGVDDGRAFFRGKTMIYIVSTDPGGGYDTYGRLVSKYLGRHLGLASVVVKNIPGGGHVKGMNAIHAARPDGLTLGTSNVGLIYAQLLGREGLSSDLRSMSWIGKAGCEARTLVVSARSPFRSMEDLRNSTRTLLLGTNGVGNESYYDALLLAHAFGLRVKFVFGMASRESQLSMMRGEIDAEVGSASTYRAFIKNGYGFGVLRVGAGEGVEKSIPDARDLARTTEGKALVDFMTSMAELLRWTVGPPGIPEDRLIVLRDAYVSTLSDPGLLEEARRLDIPIAPMDGATLAGEVDRLLDLPAPTKALIASIANRERH